MVASRENMMFVPFVIENDRKNTGFAAWRDAGNYYSIAGANFSLLRGGYGYIKGLRVEWSIGNAAVVLTANVCNFLGIDETGQIVKKTSLSDADWEDNIWLFAVLYDGTIAQVCKWNRPFNVPTTIARGLNSDLGPIIRSVDGIVLSKLAARQLASAGATALDDSGLVTAVPAVPGGVVWNQYYVNAAGKWVRAAQNVNLLNQFNNAGVPQALTANYYGIYRLYVGKETLNAADPQYYAVMNTDEFDALADAMSAVDDDLPAAATNELLALGVAHIGYVIFVETGGGDITLIGNVKNCIGNQVRQQLQINRNAEISAARDHIYRNFLTEGPEVIVAGTWLPRVDATMPYNGVFDNSTADADHDDCTCRIYIPSSGLWQLTLNAPIGPNGGILKLYLDGVQIGAPAGYDLYAAGADPLAAIVVPSHAVAAGAHELRFYVDGQNMASAGFWVLLSGLYYRRIP